MYHGDLEHVALYLNEEISSAESNPRPWQVNGIFLLYLQIVFFHKKFAHSNPSSGLYIPPNNHSDTASVHPDYPHRTHQSSCTGTAPHAVPADDHHS